MKYVVVDGLPLGLANIDGNLYAFSDACRHEGGSLSSGVLRGDIVTCPLHGWAYSVRTGKAVVPPIGLRVPTYPIEIHGTEVFVLLSWDEA
ncbi:MAG: non-heme iron oxygenase ferredoxin subunit [Herpetosiphon sp.]